MKKQPANRGKGRRFKAGTSGNPAGRPRLGETCADYLQQGLTREEWAAKIAMACKRGAAYALKLYGEYVFGRPQEQFAEPMPPTDVTSSSWIRWIESPGNEDVLKRYLAELKKEHAEGRGAFAGGNGKGAFAWPGGPRLVEKENA